jgi:hypothetical protein
MSNDDTATAVADQSEEKAFFDPATGERVSKSCASFSP